LIKSYLIELSFNECGFENGRERYLYEATCPNEAVYMYFKSEYGQYAKEYKQPIYEKYLESYQFDVLYHELYDVIVGNSEGWGCCIFVYELKNNKFQRLMDYCH